MTKNLIEQCTKNKDGLEDRERVLMGCGELTK